jgi:hypothetical protein
MESSAFEFKMFEVGCGAQAIACAHGSVLFAMGLVPIDRHFAIDWPQGVRAREKATNNRKSIRNYSHKKQAHGNSIRD